MAKKLWNDFEVETFLFEDRPAKIVYPKVKPNGKLLIKTEYWNAFPEFEIEMVKRGCYKAHGAPIKVISRSMGGHHPHGLDDPTPIIEFIEIYC